MFTQLRLLAAHLRWRSDPFVVLLVFSGLFIVYGTMLPFQFSVNGEHVEARLRRIWEHPWPTASRADVVSNVLLFMPWGFLLAAWRGKCGTGYPGAAVLGLLTGFLLSGAVECAQLFTPSRTASFIDIVTNTAGSTLGAMVGWPFARWAWPRIALKLRHLTVQRPMAACALAVAAGLTVTALAPFDISVQVSELKTAIKTARLVPFGPTLDGATAPVKAWPLASDLLVWMLAGGLFALAAREGGRRDGSATLVAVIAAVALCLATEFIQIVIPSHRFDLTTVVMALIGSTVGAVSLVSSRSRSARDSITPAFCIWGGVVALRFWAPPNFAWPGPPIVRPEWLVPFWSYYIRTNAAALADMIDQVLIFIPLGVLLAARSHRRSIMQAALIGFIVGLVMETGQVFLPERTAELTDALSASVGAGLGLALWRWGESVRDPTSSLGVARYHVGSSDD
jgi:glycopeptide antibiotics resistance protein